MAKTKFLILSTQRTGSTFFTLLLNNHPQIECHGEVFLNFYASHDGLLWTVKRWKSKKEFAIFNRFYKHKFLSLLVQILWYRTVRRYILEFYNNPLHPGAFTKLSESGVLHQRKENSKSIGFKLMYGQYTRLILFRKLLFNGAKIIHFKRRNALNVIISRGFNKVYKQYHTEKTIDREPVTLDAKWADNVYSKMASKIKTFDALLSNYNCFTVYYEDIISDNSKELERVYSFLGVDNLKLKQPYLRKLSGNSQKENVKNYSELKEAFKNHDLAQYFED